MKHEDKYGIDSVILEAIKLIKSIESHYIKIYHPKIDRTVFLIEIEESDIDLVNISTLSIRLENLSKAYQESHYENLKKFNDKTTDNKDIIDELKSKILKLKTLKINIQINTLANLLEEMEKKLLTIENLIAKILDINLEEKFFNKKRRNEIYRVDGFCIGSSQRERNSESDEEKILYQINLFKRKLDDLISSKYWKSLIPIKLDQNYNPNEEFLFSKLFDKNSINLIDRQRIHNSVSILNDIKAKVSENNIDTKSYRQCLKNIKENINDHFKFLENLESETQSFILNRLSNLEESIEAISKLIFNLKSPPPDDQRPLKKRRILENNNQDIPQYSLENSIYRIPEENSHAKKLLNGKTEHQHWSK